MGLECDLLLLSQLLQETQIQGKLIVNDPVFQKVFTGSSAGKESACNSEDLGSIPRSGRSPGEGIGYPLQYSWASVVAQVVKNLPAMQETWERKIPTQGRKDPNPGKEMVTHYSILAGRIHMDRGAWWSTVHGVAMSWTRLITAFQKEYSVFISNGHPRCNSRIYPRFLPQLEKTHEIFPPCEMRPDSPALCPEQLCFPNQTCKEPRFA